MYLQSYVLDPVRPVGRAANAYAHIPEDNNMQPPMQQYAPPTVYYAEQKEAVPPVYEDEAKVIPTQY